LGIGKQAFEAEYNDRAAVERKFEFVLVLGERLIHGGEGEL
jgi:hypothetical protein